MYKITLLSLAIPLSSFTATVNAKPITQQMTACGDHEIKTISTNCKNQTTSFSLGYQLKKYANSGSILNIENPTTRNISIDQVELYKANKQRCELDSWSPDGETIYAKSNFEVMTSECKPQQIRKAVFVIGKQRYVF